jgi:AAA ATPase domain
VHEKAGGSAVQIVGREAELEALTAFLDGPANALVLSGGPGIGKSTLWEAGTAAARERGIRVLSTRASDARPRLSFAALVDLFDGVDTTAFREVPSPQLSALNVALLRAEPDGPPPESGAIALGFLNALRALTAHGPVLVAIDDVQWLDNSSSRVLAFAARRLDRPGLGYLLARRPGRVSELERALDADRLEVGALSFGAIRRLLAERLGLGLSRHVARRLFDATLGNPLFALEVGRLVAEEGLGPDDELPVPTGVEDLFGPRIARLSAPVRRVLLAVALSPRLRLTELVELADTDAADDAVDAGVLVV